MDAGEAANGGSKPAFAGCSGGSSGNAKLCQLFRCDKCVFRGEFLFCFLQAEPEPRGRAGFLPFPCFNDLFRGVKHDADRLCCHTGLSRCGGTQWGTLRCWGGCGSVLRHRLYRTPSVESFTCRDGVAGVGDFWQENGFVSQGMGRERVAMLEVGENSRLGVNCSFLPPFSRRKGGETLGKHKEGLHNPPRKSATLSRRSNPP